MKEEAVVLTTGLASSEAGRIARLLLFFGIPPHFATSEEFLIERTGLKEGHRTCRLFCSAEIFLQLVEAGLRPERIHSVFVQSQTDSIPRLHSALTSGVGIYFGGEGEEFIRLGGRRFG